MTKNKLKSYIYKILVSIPNCDQHEIGKREAIFINKKRIPKPFLLNFPKYKGKGSIKCLTGKEETFLLNKFR